MAKITIEGTEEQIIDSIGGSRRKPRAKNGESETAKVNRRIAAEHKLLREAFELVRRTPEDKALAETFLRALVDLSKRTKTVLESAERVIAERKPH